MANYTDKEKMDGKTALSGLSSQEYRDWAAFALALEVSAMRPYKGEETRAAIERNFNTIRASIPSKPFFIRL
jgi:hypothetical protein